MKIDRRMIKCGVCGTTSEQGVIMSYSSFGYPDFDLKPSNAESTIGGNIQECPNCHYCSYDISEVIEKRFRNNVELWKKENEQVINECDGNIRRIVLLGRQYENNLDYDNFYNILLQSYWICDEEEKKGFADEIISTYEEKIKVEQINKLLQYADILRMNGDFEDSKRTLEAVKLLNKENGNTKKIIEAELKFNEAKDTARHNLSEIFRED